MAGKIISRGDIVLVNLEPVVGSEQGKTRPALVVQNDIANETSPTTIIAPITSKIYSKEFPTNVEVDTKFGLSVKSTILLNQIRTVDKLRIIKLLGHLDSIKMRKVDSAIKVSLGLI